MCSVTRKMFHILESVVSSSSKCSWFWFLNRNHLYDPHSINNRDFYVSWYIVWWANCWILLKWITKYWFSCTSSFIVFFDNTPRFFSYTAMHYLFQIQCYSTEFRKISANDCPSSLGITNSFFPDFLGAKMVHGCF